MVSQKTSENCFWQYGGRAVSNATVGRGGHWNLAAWQLWVPDGTVPSGSPIYGVEEENEKQENGAIETTCILLRRGEKDGKKT